MMDRVKKAAGEFRIEPSFNLWNAVFNALLVMATLAGSFYLMKSDIRDQNTHIVAIESALHERAGDHDRIIDMAADVRWLRVMVEKRADASSLPMKPVSVK